MGLIYLDPFKVGETKTKRSFDNVVDILNSRPQIVTLYYELNDKSRIKLLNLSKESINSYLKEPDSKEVLAKDVHINDSNYYSSHENWMSFSFNVFTPKEVAEKLKFFRYNVGFSSEVISHNPIHIHFGLKEEKSPKYSMNLFDKKTISLKLFLENYLHVIESSDTWLRKHSLLKELNL